MSRSLTQGLAIDIGTSKITLVQFDFSSMEVVQTVTEENASDVPLYDTCRHEQDPLITWSIVQALLQKMTSLASVEFIAITAQAHGILLIDQMGNPRTNLITWRDARPVQLPTKESYKQANGCLLHKGYAGRTLVSLVQGGLPSEPSHICTIASFILGKLSGCFSIDETLASSTGVFDIQNRCWNAPQLQALGIPLSLFPPTIAPCTPVGKILAPVAQEFGLPSSTLVCSPIGDNQASFLGSTGFTMAGVVNIGTGGQFSIPGKSENPSPAVEVRPLLGFSFIQVYASLCGGWSYLYLKNFCKDMLLQFGVEATDKQVYETRNRLALEAGPENTLQVDTEFLGNRCGDEVNGSITHIDTHNFTLGNLAQAFLRGIVKELHTPFIKMEGISFLVASGNAVRKNPVMVTLLQEEFGLPVVLSPFLDEAAIGSLFGCASLLGGDVYKQKIAAFYRAHFNI